MRGLVDDLKAVTSGRWLRDASPLDNTVISVATLCVYLAVILVAEARLECKLTMLALLMWNVAALGIGNSLCDSLCVNGCVLLRQVGGEKQYERRLDLARALIEESGRDDWAIRLGMITPQNVPRREEKEEAQQCKSAVKDEPVTM